MTETFERPAGLGESARQGSGRTAADQAAGPLSGLAITRLARAGTQGSPARGRVSASLRSHESSIPCNGLNRSDPEGVPLSRAGSSALAAPTPLSGLQREGASAS